MNKIVILLSFLTISSCATIDSISKYNEDTLQAKIYQEYISNKSKTKVLVVGSLPTWRSINLLGKEEVSSIYSNRYYFSTEQESIEIAMIEALEYCRIDSSWNGRKENNCQIAMVLDFNANEVEREYGKFLLSNFKDYFEITIKNLGFDNECRFDTNTNARFKWNACSIKIRYKVELPKSYPQQDRV